MTGVLSVNMEIIKVSAMFRERENQGTEELYSEPERGDLGILSLLLVNQVKERAVDATGRVVGHSS